MSVASSISFNANAAFVMCLELGFYSLSSSFISGGWSSSAVYSVPSIECGTTQTPLSYCTYSTAPQKYTFPFILTQLSCPAPPTPSYSLSGPDPSEGLLVVGTAGAAPGSICNASSLLAGVLNDLCNAVGLGGYIGSPRFDGSSGSVIYTSTTCYEGGTPSSVPCIAPYISDEEIPMCTHKNNDVGLYCAVQTLSLLQISRDPATNAVLVRRATSDAWAGVCFDSMRSTSSFGRAACASLGYATFYPNVKSTQNLSPSGMSLTNVNCPNVKNISNVGQCTYNTSTFCGSYATVECGFDTTKFVLINGQSSTSGSVYLRPTDNAPWGPLCGNGNTTNAVASRLCASVGLAGLDGTAISSVGGSDATNGQPVYGFVASTGVIEANKFASTVVCPESNIVAISCATPQHKAYEFSLPSFGSSRATPLRVRPAGSTEWGYIRLFSATTRIPAAVASAACLSVNPSVFVFNEVSMLVATGPSTQYFDIIGCLDNATNLGDCSLNTTISNTANATVFSPACSYRTWNSRINRTSSSSPQRFYSGRLEVQPIANIPAPWGTVCAVGLENVATICPTVLGSLLGNGLVGRVIPTSTAGTGPVYMSNLSCPIGSSDVRGCSFTNQSMIMRLSASLSSYCTHEQDVSIECALPALAAASFVPQGGCNVWAQPCTVVYALNGSYGVCYDYSTFMSAAAAFCNSLGLGSTIGTVTYSSNAGLVSSFATFACASGLLDPRQCVQTFDLPCSTSTFLQVRCLEPDLQFKLINSRYTPSGTIVGTVLASSRNANTTGVLCGSAFDANSLSAACRLVGLDGMVPIQSTISASTTGYPVIIDSINCSSQLPFSNSTPCVALPSVGTCTTATQIECAMPSNNGWIVKATVSIGQQLGLLLLRPNSSAPWGLVGSPRAGSFFTATAQALLCDAMYPQYGGHLTFGTVFESRYYSTSIYPLYGTDIRCSVNATSFSQCVIDIRDIASASYLQLPSCVLDMNAFNFRLRPLLTITLPTTNTTMGVVEMQPKRSSGAWGTVCAGPDAEGLCSLAGYAGSNSMNVPCPAYSLTASNGMPMYAIGKSLYPSVYLPASTNASCSHLNDTCVVCAYQPQAQSTTAQTSGQTTWTIALQDVARSETIPAGTPRLVYVRPNASMAWGLVCDSTGSWTTNEANMFCTWSGCAGCRAVWTRWPQGALYGPVFLDQVNCPAAGASSIASCTYQEFMNATSNCAASYAMALSCVAPYNPTIPTNVPQSLVDSGRAAMFLLSGSTSLSTLQASISGYFGVQVIITSTTFTQTSSATILARSANVLASPATSLDATSALVEFSSAADCMKVVAEANNVTSTFATQNTFILGASALTTATPVTPP
ncbi:scavenger receptor cysteine-rich type 1 protein, putative, partial [Bodo saltans]